MVGAEKVLMINAIGIDFHSCGIMLFHEGKEQEEKLSYNFSSAVNTYSSLLVARRVLSQKL